MDEKVALLAVLEAVFARPTGDRVLRFDEIQAVCRVDEADVGASDGTEAQIEPFLIHGARLGLFKCLINSLEKKVVFTWLQPRVGLGMACEVDAGPGAGGDDDEDAESVGAEHSRYVAVCDEEGDGGLRIEEGSGMGGMCCMGVFVRTMKGGCV